MSFESEEHFVMDPTSDTKKEFLRMPRYSYTREFLLSLSGLEVCKSLPNGFDESLLREFEEASQDRPRNSGPFLPHGFKRNEYGSSPPTRGELGNYGRGIHGRWNSRSSGLSDRDSDSQSDRDSDTGRRYGNQNRRPSQISEHDGLLGKGSFPRPSGFPDPAAPRLQSDEGYQLNRANEPYHPPRPNKALPQSRRDTKDSYNDETFGCSDSTSEDRAEEERKRRASFELLRREQQKAFQERQKLNPEKRKDDFDISVLLEDSKDEKRLQNSSKEADEPVALPDPQSSFPSQNHATRPLVPPGFASTNLERSVGTKAYVIPQPTEASKTQSEGVFLQAKGNHLSGGTIAIQKEKQMVEQIGLDGQERENMKVIDSANSTMEESLNFSAAPDVYMKAVAMNKQLNEFSKYPEVVDAPNNGEVVGLNVKVEQNKVLENSSQKNGSSVESVLDKIFESALALSATGESTFLERIENKEADVWSPRNVKSSKFAYLFEEAPAEKKPVDNIPSSRQPNDLLSLIWGSDKDGSEVLDMQAAANLSPRFPLRGSDVENSEQSCNINISKSGASPPVLTCEDLEQSILSEINESHPTLQQTTQQWDSGVMTKQQKSDVDDRASQHLLLLLQKGASARDMVLPPNTDRPLEQHRNSGGANAGDERNTSNEADTGNGFKPVKTLTLEALFGTAFMKELQSVGDPVAGRVDTPENHVSPLQTNNDDLHPVGSSGSSYAPIQKGHVRPDPFPESLLGYPEHRTFSDSSKHQSEFLSELGGLDQSVGVRLPEEDGLITTRHSPNLQSFMSLRDPARLDSEASIDINQKLAALNAAMKDERPFVGGQEDIRLLRQPQYMRETEVPFHPNIQPSPLHPHSPPLNNAGPGFHPLDSHGSHFRPPINLVAPENIIYHDPPGNQFPANAGRPPFRHPSSRISDLGHIPLSMLQQMHLSGSLPPAHMVQGFPNGVPRPPHVNPQVAGLSPEMNAMQGFPFGHRPANYVGSGIPPVADASRSDQSASLQRLMGLNLRPDTMQNRPLGPAGSNQGQQHHHHGRELEMLMGLGFR